MVTADRVRWGGMFTKGKSINLSEIMMPIVDLSTHTPRVMGGRFSGSKITFSGAVKWESSLKPDINIFQLNEQIGEISLRSERGNFTMKGARISHRDMDNRVKGICLSTNLEIIPTIKLNKIVYRSYTKIRENAQIPFFPKSISFQWKERKIKRKLPEGLQKIIFKSSMIVDNFDIDLPSQITSLLDKAIREEITYTTTSKTRLPLEVNGYDVDVMYFNKGSRIIIETSGDIGSIGEIQKIVVATKRVISYLTGLRLDAAPTDVILDKESSKIAQIKWSSGRLAEELDKRFYHPVPVMWSDIAAAARSVDDTSYTGALSSNTLSSCIEAVMADENLVTPIEYLTRFQHSPLEMRGAPLSVALESITSIVESNLDKKSSTLIDKKSWNPIRKELLNVLKSSTKDWESAEKDAVTVMENKINGLNYIPNSIKLLRPFDSAGIPVTEDEKNAMKNRNKFLHKGALLKAEDRIKNRDAWREVYLIEMQIYTAINKLLLKHIGYSGFVIDWGRTSIDSGERKFVRI